MFSGVGGFELGIQNAMEKRGCGQKETEVEGCESVPVGKPNFGQHADCVGYSEIDKYAIQIYQKQFKGHKNYGDATKIKPETLPDFDMLCGGFPCQSFSIAGKRGGFNDTRGTLFFDIARIVKVKRPKILFLENVKGLLNHNKGETFRVILQTLDELGYDVQWQVLNSKNFGVPQNRERVFIIGNLRGTSRPKVFPFGATDRTSNKEDTKVCRCHTARYFKGGNGTHVKALDIYNKNIKDESPTLTDPMYNSIKVTDGLRIRKLTPIECERLQGFPDRWTEGLSDTQRYKTMDNAVTVNVIQAVAERIMTKAKANLGDTKDE